MSRYNRFDLTSNWEYSIFQKISIDTHNDPIKPGTHWTIDLSLWLQRPNKACLSHLPFTEGQDLLLKRKLFFHTWRESALLGNTFFFANSNPLTL